MNSIGDYDYSHYMPGNSVNSVQTEWSDDPAYLPTAITYAVAFIVGVVGNALVVFSLIVEKNSRNVTSSLLVSLAVADLVFLLVFVPYEVAVKMATQWIAGVALCKFAAFAEMLSAVASILNLTAVTVERYVVIVHPMKSRSWCTMGSAKKILLGVWTVAILLSSPMLYVMDTTTHLFYNNDTRVTREICADDNFTSTLERVVFAWYQLVVMFLGPTIVLIYCYAVVIRVLWLSTKELERMTSTGDALLETDEDGKRRLTSRSDRSIIRRTVRDHSAEVREARKQVIKMLLTIICIFLLCWGPKLILNIMKRHELSILHRDEAFWITVTINLLPYVQSAVNPIIYGFMSNNFRRGLRETMRACYSCRCCCPLAHRPQNLLIDMDTETKSITMNGVYTSGAMRQNQSTVTAVSEF